jgi:predicted outer membrane repeat protein
MSVSLSVRVRAVAVATLAAATLIVGPASASAASTVNVPCNATALSTAITNASGAGPATLNLAVGCAYVLKTAATVSEALPLITGNVTIHGSSNSFQMDASLTNHRILNVSSGAKLTLDGVTFTGGNTTGLAGAILDTGTLNVSNATFFNNKAGNGGAVDVAAGATATFATTSFSSNHSTSVGGGAIINFGTVTITGSQFTSNTAPINGGAINTQPGGSTKIVDSSFLANVSGGLGGAISNLGTTTIKGTTIQANQGSSGGGIATGNPNVTISGSTIGGNRPDNCNPLNTISGCRN